MSSGRWIKLHASTLESLAMSDDWLCRLWMTCLLKANWRVGYFRGYTINPGQFAFSQRLWCEQLGASRNKLSRGLKALEKAGQIELKTGHQFSVVTICNWGTYQNGDKTDRATNDTTNGATNDTTDGATKGPPTIPPMVNDSRRAEGQKDKGAELDAGASCTEPEKSGSVPADSVMEFPTTGTVQAWHLTTAKLAEWQTTYDTLDVPQECRKARQWILDNPAKRKTARGMAGFLGRWLNRAVDSGRGTASGANQPAKRGFNEPDHTGLQAWFEEAEADERPRLTDESTEFEGGLPF